MKGFAKRYDLPVSSFHQGSNFHAYELFTPKVSKRKTASGVVFRVWAPNAASISVVGNFNDWDRNSNPMEKLADCDFWEAFVPNVKQGDKYLFSVEDSCGNIAEKTDPYSVCISDDKSVYFDISRFSWKDEEWLQHRKLRRHLSEPMNIYEAHLASWKVSDKSQVNYKKFADEIVPYLVELGYTHLQLLPIMEHFEGSWGYEVKNLYSPASHFGSPKDFMYLVNKCHQNNIGIIIDWVPSHFPMFERGLHNFDGQPCYEYPMANFNSCIFDFGKPEVQSYLISNVVYWIEKYHIDGLRVDSLSSILYLDGKKFNQHENLESVDFLKRMNSFLSSEYPDVMMMAEESTAVPMVTKPVYAGGLGFNFKWNRGWSHDILQYISLDPIYRSYNHDKLTFSLMYAFSENFLLPLSHDEFTNGKGSLIEKMPGEHSQKFAGVRALLGYMMSHPGKKLNFMGCEIGQFLEWNESQPIDWNLLEYESHRNLQNYVKDLNHLYKNTRALWEIDNSWDGFQWLVHDDQNQCVLAFRRSDEDGDELISISNFTPVERDFYRIGIPQFKDYKIILNSNDAKYGGSAKENPEIIRCEYNPMHGKPYSILLDIPPLSTVYLVPADENSSESKNLILDAVIAK